MSVKVYKNGSLQTIAGVAVEPLTGTRDEIETYANSGQLIDGQIAYITDDYIAADAVVTDDVLKTKEAVSAVTSYGKVADAMVIKELQSNFQAGVDGIYDAIVAKGTTPASKSLSDIINTLNVAISTSFIPYNYNSRGAITYDLSRFGGYKSLSASNFKLSFNSIYRQLMGSGGSSANASNDTTYNMSFIYDTSNGRLTVPDVFLNPTSDASHQLARCGLDGLVLVTSDDPIAIFTGDTASQTINIASKYPGYQNLTVEDFILVATKVRCKYYSIGGSSGNGSWSETQQVSLSYDASTGVLTIPAMLVYKSLTTQLNGTIGVAEGEVYIQKKVTK